MSIYDDMAAALVDEMEESGQGELIYLEPGSNSGSAWNPQTGEPDEHPCKGVARGVQQRYISDTISASDIQCLITPFDTEPALEGKFSIDGAVKQILQINRIPAAGTLVAWRIFCKA